MLLSILRPRIVRQGKLNSALGKISTAIARWPLVMWDSTLLATNSPEVFGQRQDVDDAPKLSANAFMKMFVHSDGGKPCLGLHGAFTTWDASCRRFPSRAFGLTSRGVVGLYRLGTPFMPNGVYPGGTWLPGRMTQ